MRSCARSSSCAAAALLLSLAGPSPGAVADEELHVHGFVSQGWFNSRHNNFLIDDSRDGTAEFNEAAVSLQVMTHERLRVGAQFLARDFGNTGNGAVRLDWAYGDWMWRDWLGVRIGKIKTVIGLYGEGRDVDVLRPTVLLPQSVYFEGHRDFIVGVQGGGLHGNIPLSDAGGFDYDAWAGTLNVPDSDQGFWRDINTETGLDAADALTEDWGTPVSYLGSTDEAVRFRWIAGGSLFWNAPLSGLRAGASYLGGRFEMDARYTFGREVADPADPVRLQLFEIDGDIHGSLDHIATLSGEWTPGPWTFAAEHYLERVNGHTSYGSYLLASLLVGERTTLTGYASRFVRDSDDPDGDQYVEEGLPDFVAWQNDFCAAVRHDVNRHWLLKAEYHLVDGMGQLSIAKNDIDDPDAFRRWWSYVAVKATYHF